MELVLEREQTRVVEMIINRIHSARILHVIFSFFFPPVPFLAVFTDVVAVAGEVVVFLERERELDEPGFGFGEAQTT